MSRVDHPDHYQTNAGLEAVDVIEAFFHDNFHLGNVFKYIARAGKKGDYVEDLEKAAWYLQREIDSRASQATKEVVRLREEIDRLKWYCLDGCRAAEAEEAHTTGEHRAREQGKQEAYYGTYLQITQGQHKENK